MVWFSTAVVLMPDFSFVCSIRVAAFFLRCCFTRSFGLPEGAAGLSCAAGSGIAAAIALKLLARCF
ncbi:hypothetical protein U1Q18_038911 [Sarracenia purpurea var. burkii]